MAMIFMTGLSGAGKSTLAREVQLRLSALRIPAEVFDGDEYRQTMNNDLDFSAGGRRENILRLATLAHKKNSGGISIIAAINPFEDQRIELAKKFGAKIIWIYCDLKILIKRDTKGLYKKALLPDSHPDKLLNLTGVNDPYEVPGNPDLLINTSEAPVAVCAEQLFNYVLIARNGSGTLTSSS